MKNTIVALALSFGCVASHADPGLAGKWRSDKQLTMSFARERAKLEDRTLLFLDQMMGRMTITFTQSHITSVMPDWQNETADGVKSNLVGFTEKHRYKVLGTTATQVAISSVEPVTGRRAITVFNFTDENTMWVYLGGAAFPQMNTREYFVRIQ